MEFFPILANLLAIAAIVTGLAVGAWYVIGLYWVHSRKVEEELPEIELPAHLHEVFTGVPAALIIFYAFIAASLVVYVLYIWLGGITY